MTYVGEQKTGRLIYSLLASYGAERGGLLPGSWFVEVLAPFGHTPVSVRQTLYRMAREGSLEVVPSGRHKLYRFSPIGRASTDAGTARFRALPTTAWDGCWTVVSFEFRSDQRRLRDLVAGLLSVDGFACLTRGTYVHPRDRTEQIGTSLRDADASGQVHVFRAERIAGQSDESLIQQLWDLDSIRSGYESFLTKFGPLARRRRWDRVDHVESVATRFALVMTYLETAWRDPDIPTILLPARWPAAKARALASELHQRLHQPLMEYGDHVFQRMPASIRRESAA